MGRNLKVLEKVLGSYEMTSRGWAQFKCPFCSDQNRHFGVAPEGNAHCLRCEINLDSVKLLRFIRRTGMVQAYSEIPESKREIPSRWTEDPLGDFMRGWTRLSRPGRSLIERRAIKYLLSRKIDLEKYELGMLNGRPGYVYWLFRMNNIPVYFQGRAVTRGCKPKTLNPPLKRGGVVPFYDMIEPKADIVFVEGPFDAVAVTGDEYTAIPLLSKSISDRQIQLICRKNPRSFFVMLDPPSVKDKTMKAAIILAKKLDRTSVPTYIIKWPKGEERDPSDLGHRLSNHYINEYAVLFHPLRSL